MENLPSKDSCHDFCKHVSIFHYRWSMSIFHAVPSGGVSLRIASSTRQNMTDGITEPILLATNYAAAQSRNMKLRTFCNVSDSQLDSANLRAMCSKKISFRKTVELTDCKTIPSAAVVDKPKLFCCNAENLHYACVTCGQFHKWLRGSCSSRFRRQIHSSFISQIIY